jgi:uncharacterized protein (DUF433 family)/PHD/YefM family antitoxin component YafN of YafNO toxin-antitoxin module
VNVYTYSEARQKLASLLEQAAREGQVRIQRKDGQAFVIQPAQRRASPLDVESLNLDLRADEIVQMVREGRRTDYGITPDWRDYVEAVDRGPATLRGTGVPVAAILDDLAAGSGPDEVVGRRPDLTREMVEAAIRYAADLTR